MRFLDSHVHMVSRTTDDYQRMAASGVTAIIEPSFWQGQPRTEPGTFKDYFNTLIGFERFRASQFGIKHYCTIGLNPKEANNEKLAEAVMELLLEPLSHPTLSELADWACGEAGTLHTSQISHLRTGKAVMLGWQKHSPWADTVTIDGRTATVAHTPFYDPRGAHARL